MFIPFTICVVNAGPPDFTNETLMLGTACGKIRAEKRNLWRKLNMRKVLPVILILLGIVEIIIAVMNIKMPIIVAILLGVMFIALGVKTLLDASKKK